MSAIFRKRSSFFLLVLSLSCLCLPARAAPPEEVEPPKEKQLLLWKVPATGSRALIPDISLIGTFAGGFFRDDPGDDQGENPSRTGFNFQGVELAVQSVVDPYVRGDIFILFIEDGVEVEEAILSTLSLPLSLQIRGGVLLPKFGRQVTQHLEKLDFVDFSRVNRHFFGEEGFSELGVELSLLVPVSWFSEISFEFLQGENEGNFDGVRKGDFAYLGHLTNTFDLSNDLTLQTGLSGVFGFNDTARGNSTQIYGTDLYLRWKPSPRRGLKWQTEYFLRRREVVGDTEVEGGLYSQVVGQFARRWETGLRFERIGLPVEGVPEWSLTPTIAFLATEFFRLRAQYSLIDTNASTHLQHEAFLQAQFNMGVHGAHSF